MKDNELTHPEPGKAQAGKAQPGKAEPAKAEPGKAEPAKAGARRTETGKAETGRAETGRAETGRAEAGGGRADEITAAVAARVRSLRTARGWSLDELAGRSGVSKGMVVQIEAARTNPSIATLCRLAEAFGVTMVRLLEPSTERVVRINDVSAAAELWHGDRGGSGRLLAGLGEASFVELWDWRLEPGEEHRSPDHSAGTREVLHVLQGTLTATVDGVPYKVKTGQTIEFLADRHHDYRNTGNDSCRIAMVVATPTGEHDRRGA